MSAVTGRAAFVHALFCEDVRFEANGAITMLGVMPPRIQVPSFPYVFPRICVFVGVMAVPELDLKGAEVALYVGANKAVTMSIPSPPPPPKGGIGSPASVLLHLIMRATDMKLEQIEPKPEDAMLSIKLICAGGAFDSNSLIISPASQIASANPTINPSAPPTSA